MKRNGFTLVEMMAVIVLLAVLTVIGVATYTNVNESAKQKSLESKKEEIRSSAMKWARENNITNKTLISVNALVVEGYLTAEKNEMGKIGYIENPVTGENMICNTVDIHFQDSEMIADVNDTIQNCDLATQSLVDENIQIKVIDENNVNKTGSKSMSNWTNKNVIIVVTSPEYDPNAVSVSFDFEGNTKTKMKSGSTPYTGSNYISESTAKNHYNVFNVDGNLLIDSAVVVSYTLNDGTVKSRSYRIRIDKEEATASIKSNNEWLTVEKPIYVLVDDGQGSGAKGFIVSTDSDCNDIVVNKNQESYDGTPVTLDIGKYYIWTEDNAGNRSVKPKVIFEVNNVDATVPECEVLFHGTEGDHGWYKENPVQPSGHNTIPAGISGFNLGVNQSENSPEYTAYAEYDTFNEGYGEKRITNTVKAGELYWCHAKTLAGNYNNNSKRLYLDMDPPTISVSLTNPDVHTQTKAATFTLHDALSGLNSTTNIRIGFSLSPTGGPTTWETVSITAPEQTNQVISKTVTVGSSLTGTYYLYIDTSAFKDYAGNYADPPAMSNGAHMFVYGPFKFDNTPPVCNGNNGKTNWTLGTYTIYQYCIDNYGTTDQSLCAQDTYTIFYGTDRTVKNDSVVIYDNAGNYTTCPYNVYLDNTPPVCDGEGGKTNWTKGTYTVVQRCSEDANTQSGCLQPTFSKYYGTSDTYKDDTIVISDYVGNTTVCGTHVYLDNTPPTCEGTTGENTNWTQAAQTVFVRCADGVNQSGCYQMFFDKTHSDTTKTDTIVIRDNVDNQTVCGAYNYYVDVTKPVCGANNGKTNWTKGGYNITVACSDGTNQSGCTQDPFAKIYTALQTVQDDSLTIVDNAGNTQTCGYSVYIDNTAPVCGTNDGKTYWTKGSTSVTVNCSDAHSGCKLPSYTSTWDGVTVADSIIVIHDNVENTRSCSVNVYLDNTAPKCGTASGENTTYTKSPVTVSVGCSDDHSGCSASSFSKTNSSTTVTDSIGISDAVGNTATCGPYNFYVDTTPPSCGSASGQNSTWTTSNVTVSVGCSDGHSGCTSSTFSNTWSSTTRTDSITISDKAGNTTSCGPYNIYIDKTAPTCGSDNSKWYWTTGSWEGKVNCSDSHSGCGQSQYTYTWGSDVSASASAIYIYDKVGNRELCPIVISLDNEDPVCYVSKTHTGTSGVTVSITNYDGFSGVKPGAQTMDSGLKSSKSYTVYDNVNHSYTCSVSVSEVDCNCETCTSSTCAKWTCSGGYSCTGTAANCTGQGCPTCSSFTSKSTCNGNTGCSWSCGGWTCSEYETYACNCDTCYE